MPSIKHSLLITKNNEQITCRFELFVLENDNREPVDGAEITWKDCNGSHVEHTEITMIVLNETTDDSDFTFMEPFINKFAIFFSLKSINDLEQNIVCDPTFRNIGAPSIKNVKRRNQKIMEHFDPIIEACRKASIETLYKKFEDLEQYNNRCNKTIDKPMSKHDKHALTSTIVNGAIAMKILSRLPKEQNKCPHY
jgi:hypothetical protein